MSWYWDQVSQDSKQCKKNLKKLGNFEKLQKKNKKHGRPSSKFFHISFSPAMEAAWTSKIPGIPNKRRKKVVFIAIFDLVQRAPHSGQIEAQLFKGSFVRKLIKKSFSIILIIVNDIYYGLYWLISRLNQIN